MSGREAKTCPIERLKPAILSRLQLIDCEGENLALTRSHLMDAVSVIEQLVAANARIEQLQRALSMPGIEDLIATRDMLRGLLRECYDKLESIQIANEDSSMDNFLGRVFRATAGSDA